VAGSVGRQLGWERSPAQEASQGKNLDKTSISAGAGGKLSYFYLQAVGEGASGQKIALN